MFYNLFTNLISCIMDRWSDFASNLKCYSSCCNRVNVYNPKSSCVQTGEIWNKWARCTTQGTESPNFKRGETTFFLRHKINNRYIYIYVLCNILCLFKM